METAKTNKLSKRIIEIDVLRGIAVFLMILDHMMYDLFGLFPFVFEDYPEKVEWVQKLRDFAVWYWYWDFRVIFRYFVVFAFLGLTGVCCSFSKSNLKRGLKLMGVALLLTLGTFIAGKVVNDPEMTIAFGILHSIALSLILIGLLEKIIPFKWSWIYLAIGVVMFTAGSLLEEIQTFRSYTEGDIFKTVVNSIIGINSCGSDHAPLLLNGGQIFIGVFLGRTLYYNRKSLIKNSSYSNNIVTFIGRNSLWVYFAHQVLIPIIFGIIFLICGFKFNI